METIVLKAICKAPSDRYPTAKDLADDLRRFLDGKPVVARRATLADRAAKWCLRHKRGVAAAAAVLVAAVAALAAAVALVSNEKAKALVERDRANARERESRQLLCAADVRLAATALKKGEWARARDSLNRHLPRQGELDVRDFAWHWLAAALDAHTPRLAVFDENPGEVYHIDYSPDGALLSAACAGGQVVLWDVENQRIHRQFAAHASDCNCAIFSPAGERLVTSGDDLAVRIWNVATGEREAELRDHHHPVVGAAFLPDGRRLVSCDDGGLILLIDAATRRVEARLKEHTGRIDYFSATRDGSTLITVGADGATIVWDLDAGAMLWRVDELDKPLAVACSPDGDTFATASGEGVLRLWSLAERKPLVMLGTRRDAIKSVAFSRDGTTLAASGDDGITQLWDVTSRSSGLVGVADPATQLRTQTGAHASRVWSVAFSPDGRSLATSGRDRTIQLWDHVARPGERTICAEGDVGYFAISPDATTLATSSNAGHDVSVWDIASGRRTARLDLGPVHASRFAWLASSADSVLGSAPASRPGLAVGTPDGRLLLWRPADDSQRTLLERPVGISDVCYLPDSRLIAVAYGDGDLILCDCETDEIVVHENVNPSNAPHFALAPDGHTLAAAAYQTLRLFDCQRRAWIPSRLGDFARIDAVAFSPDGRTLALAGHDATIKLVDVTVAQDSVAASAPASRADNVAGSGPASTAGSVVGSAPASRADGVTLLGHELNVVAVAFSPDGRVLASSAGDGTVRLWSIAAGQELYTIGRSPHPAGQVAFSPDGRWLAAGMTDVFNGATLGAVKLWELGPKEFVAQ